MSHVRFELAAGDVAFEVDGDRGGGAAITVTDPDGTQHTLHIEDLGGGRALVAIDGGARSVAWFARDDEALMVHMFGRAQRFELAERRGKRRSRKRGGGGDLRTPMPGVITRVLVAVGDEVAAGTPLYGLEAMKMESLIKAPTALRVTALLAQAGEQVEGGVDIVEVAAIDGEGEG